jgi:hypothetical protein
LNRAKVTPPSWLSSHASISLLSKTVPAASSAKVEVVVHRPLPREGPEDKEEGITLDKALICPQVKPYENMYEANTIVMVLGTVVKSPFINMNLVAKNKNLPRIP